MSSNNTSGCENCNKGGLAILPVRYTVVPAKLGIELPSELGAARIKSVTLDKNTKYAVRSLRQGFLYVFYEKNWVSPPPPPASTPMTAKQQEDQYTQEIASLYGSYQVYSVAENGTLWRQAIPVLPHDIKEPPCGNKGDYAAASIVAIPKAATAGPVWFAFSDHAWSTDTMIQFGKDPAARSKRMQCVTPTTWISSKTHADGMEASIPNIKKIVEHHPKGTAAIKPFPKPTPCSNEKGEHQTAGFDKATSMYPVRDRFMQLEHMSEQDNNNIDTANTYSVMVNICQKDKDSANAAPMILALWDAVGIARELNGFRNETASYISQYGDERALQISAMTGIDATKKMLEEAAKHSQEDKQYPGGGYFSRSQISPDAMKDGHLFTGTKDAYDRLRYEVQYWHDPLKAYRLSDIDLAQNWEKQNVPTRIITDLIGYQAPLMKSYQDVINWNDPAMVPILVEARRRYIEDTTQRANNFIRAGNDPKKFHDAEVDDQVFQAWSDYERNLKRGDIETFRTNFEKAEDYAKTLIDARTDSLLAWLKAPLFLDTLTDLNTKNLLDGLIFQDKIGHILFGITSSFAGAKKINEWINEQKVTPTNLVWRLMAMNNDEAAEEVTHALKAATKAALSEEVWSKTDTKWITKLFDYFKKALTLHNQNQKWKTGIDTVNTGGVEKFFMTTSKLIYLPWIAKGIDTVGQKIIQSMLLVYSGRELKTILDIAIAESRLSIQDNPEAVQLISEQLAKEKAEADTAFGAKYRDKLNQWKKATASANIAKEDGSFNEALDNRYGIIVIALQALYVWQLSGDSHQDEKAKMNLAAAELSLGASLVDWGATAIKGLAASGGDKIVAYQFAKLGGGFLSLGAAAITVKFDLNDIKESAFQKGMYGKAAIYAGKLIVDLSTGSLSFLATVSYMNPYMQTLAARYPASLFARCAVIVGRLFNARAFLLLRSLQFNLASVAITVLIYLYDKARLTAWTKRCVFSIDGGMFNRYTDVKAQQDDLAEAIKGVM